MKSRLLYLAILCFVFACAEKPHPEDFDLTTRFEESGGTQTETYEEIMKFYEDLDEAYVSIKTYKIGKTDSGEPLTLVTYNPNRTFDSEFDDRMDVTRLLINNGIHPGESDGIDATMLMMRDLAEGKLKAPEDLWIGAIAVYNIGGALNRNSTSRTNQNGPEEYGFRGNARNYDLNRDFVKADTWNARTFAEIYHMVNPDFFIDNHVSNGADYQYVLTHLLTQHNKLGGKLGTYMKNEFQVKLENSLAEKDCPITPYVNVFNSVPEKGFSQFMDYPRYSTGYTTLWNTAGLMVETHMLKPYKPRVEGTYELMKTVLEIAEEDGEKVRLLRLAEREIYKTGEKTGTKYPIAFAVDSSKTSQYDFLGFEGTMEPSEVTGLERLKYHRDQPFTKEVQYYDNFKVTAEITIPKSYIIPQGWHNVIERLKENQIDFHRLQKDSTMQVEVYHIANYKTRNAAYEGHYLHYDTQVDAAIVDMAFAKGDYVVNTAQPGMRYLLETLEPAGIDSFFNWNYFDTILQQKEGFSPYVWEDKAKELLDKDPELKKEFEQKKKDESSFRESWYAQLDWLHKKSPNYEKAHLRYPIVRVLN